MSKIHHPELISILTTSFDDKKFILNEVAKEPIAAQFLSWLVKSQF